jgi:hypothetical protein
MSSRRQRSRIYWRERGGARRAYGDSGTRLTWVVGESRSRLRARSSPQQMQTSRHSCSVNGSDTWRLSGRGTSRSPTCGRS